MRSRILVVVVCGLFPFSCQCGDDKDGTPWSFSPNSMSGTDHGAPDSDSTVDVRSADGLAVEDMPRDVSLEGTDVADIGDLTDGTCEDIEAALIGWVGSNRACAACGGGCQVLDVGGLPSALHSHCSCVTAVSGAADVAEFAALVEAWQAVARTQMSCAQDPSQCGCGRNVCCDGEPGPAVCSPGGCGFAGFEPDGDADGVRDSIDNCPDTANVTQLDDDSDGVGDACAIRRADDDGDGVINGLDNCPTVVNPGQQDLDADQVGDICDNCPFTPQGPCVCPDILPQTDSDGDLIGDACDNCVAVANSDQADADNNGFGDVCDPGDQDPVCVPVTEVFDCRDNDCDGVVDDGLGSPCCPTLEVCNGVDDDCDGQVDDGCCAGCVPEMEILNGLDDDCDGSIDEGTEF